MATVRCRRIRMTIRYVPCSPHIFSMLDGIPLGNRGEYQTGAKGYEGMRGIGIFIITQSIRIQYGPYGMLAFSIASTSVTHERLRGRVRMCPISWTCFDVFGCRVVFSVDMAHKEDGQWFETRTFQAKVLNLSSCEHGGKT